jgi:hypothetical protein
MKVSARNRPEIPKTLDVVTPDWLRSAFQAEGTSLSVQSELSIRELNDTTGQDGLYAVIEDGVIGEDGPVRLFVKILNLPSDKGGFYLQQQAREHHFYRVFAPVVSARVPRFWYGDYSDDYRSGVLIIDALDGWEFGRLEVGLDLATATAIGAELGRLNGSTLDSPLLDGTCPLIRYTTDAVVTNQLAEGYQIAMKKHRSFFRDRFSTNLMSLAERIAGEALPILVDLKSGDRSINHGDCRFDNMAFRRVDDSVEITLFDFGLTTIGNGMMDFAQCVTSAWPDATESDLWSATEGYWLALREFGPYIRSLDETWEGFRKSMHGALIARVFSLHRFASVADLPSGSPLERMRFHSWWNVIQHCESLRIWELS